MQTNKKTKKPVKIVSKPYVRGTLFDKHTVFSALKFFGAMFGTTIALLCLGSTIVFDIPWLSTLLNIGLLLAMYALFMNTGSSKSVAQITQGEMLYNRRESGRTLNKEDERSCYHPLKGFVNALLGTIPFLLLALILAVTAERLMTATGTLPSWINNFENRVEIGAPLAHYHESDALTLTAVCRIVIRMLLMPFVTLIGTNNYEALLVLERISPLLVLLPAACYGFGYTRGPGLRAVVHTSIRANDRKRRKREKRMQRDRALQQPEQLN